MSGFVQQQRGRDWKIYLSDRLSAADTFNEVPELPNTAIKDSRLHLSTSVRSFRAEALDFIGAVLEGDVEGARRIRGALKDYPILLSRDLISS